MSQLIDFELFRKIHPSPHTQTNPVLKKWRHPLIDKLSNVPFEPDTTIIFQTTSKIDDLDVLWQKWVWEGIQADSLIFAASDVGHLSDEQLIELVRVSAVPHEDTEITVKRGEAHIFVNMNFVEL